LKKKIIVIGSGPAGLFSAYHLAQKANVTIIEKNNRWGKKLLITGKGRCNLTNARPIQEFKNYIIRNERFLRSSFASFTNTDLINFFEERDCKLKVEQGERVFPISNKANDILQVLIQACKGAGVKFQTGHVTEIITEENAISSVQLEDGSNIFCDAVCLATGGSSYPGTGSTGDGFEIAEKLGHKIVKPTAALIPIEIEGYLCESLMGLSLKNVKLVLKHKKKVKYSAVGEMIFTHFGISGPLVLTASCYIEKDPKEYSIRIDWKPGLTEPELDNRIQKDCKKFAKKKIDNALKALLPMKAIPIFLDICEIHPDTLMCELSKKHRKRLVENLKNFMLSPKKLRPLKEAIITAGGISTKEIDSSKMESKKIRGLYFAGEIIDVHGVTGGYNLQIAFSTAFTLADKFE
jgi:predicted Rossmann fold flavoprotein